MQMFVIVMVVCRLILRDGEGCMTGRWSTAAKGKQQQQQQKEKVQT